MDSRLKANRRKTRRGKGLHKGGLRPDIKEIIDSKPLQPNLTVNPNSNFVVVTYWWGRGNSNANTQTPCMSDLQDGIRDDMIEEMVSDPNNADNYNAEAGDKYWAWKNAQKAANSNPSDSTLVEKASKLRKAWIGWVGEYTSRPELKKKVNDAAVNAFNKKRSEGVGRDSIKFESMMKIWEDQCKKVGCNYLAAEYPFQREALVNGKKVNQYQYAINAKPYFIKKALEVCQGRGVLYIDGDMFINKFPYIFEMQGVDFMARGWNTDPRSNDKHRTALCFDPYSFETSGGTMFFANTPMSHKMLDRWVEEASKSIHDMKADDRVLSMFATSESWMAKASIVQLPIEYLWLTNIYDGRPDLEGEVDKCEIIIEHPACLTSEDTATEGTTSNRSPEGYDSQLLEHQQCDTYGGVFYEYVFFPNERMVQTFGQYLKYLSTAKHFDSGSPLFKVVPFAQQYGEYNDIATRNIEAAKAVTMPTSEQRSVKLSANTPVSEIIGYLQHDVDVQIGEDSRPLTEGIDCRAKNIAKQTAPYIREIQIDTKAPMYFSSKNGVLVHLLAMCETLADINTHLKASYIFTSRIRWDLS